MDEMQAAREKQRAKEEEEIEAFLEERARQREQDDQDLEDLKERQRARREEREEHDRYMEDLKRQQEERRKEEDDARKAKSEALKRKREEERKKKQALMSGGGIAGGGQGGGDSMSRAAAAAVERKMSPEELAALKEEHLAPFKEKLDTESLDASGLRAKIKEVHDKMSKNVAQTYDMEERHKVQEYDLRELKERKKQRLRQKAQRMGVDPEAYANAKHPPKKQVASDYDRQIDRRSYSERKQVYKPKAEKVPKVFHGSARPPTEWGVTNKSEEVENLRKNAPERKYQELEPVEGAKPPCPIVPAKEPSPEKEETTEAKE